MVAVLDGGNNAGVIRCSEWTLLPNAGAGGDAVLFMVQCAEISALDRSSRSPLGVNWTRRHDAEPVKVCSFQPDDEAWPPHQQTSQNMSGCFDSTTPPRPHKWAHYPGFSHCPTNVLRTVVDQGNVVVTEIPASCYITQAARLRSPSCLTRGRKA